MKRDKNSAEVRGAFVARILGTMISIIGIVAFGYLAIRIPNPYFLFSLAMCAVVLVWRLVPKDWLVISVAIGSGLLATIGIVGGIAQRSPLLIVIGLLCSLGLIAPFRNRKARDAEL
jgi:hypothetical protein